MIEKDCSLVTEIVSGYRRVAFGSTLPDTGVADFSEVLLAEVSTCSVSALGETKNEDRSKRKLICN